MAAGLKLMGISMSEAQISPLHIHFPRFVFCFSYVDGSPLIDTDDPAEAGKERSGSEFHISCQNTEGPFKNLTDHVL